MTLVFIIFVLLAAIILLPSQLGVQAAALDEVQTSLTVRLEQLKRDFQFRTKELARRIKSADLAEDEWQKLTDELQIDTRASIDATKIASESHKSNRSWAVTISLMIGVIAISYVTYQFSGSYEQANQQITISNQLENDPLTIDKLRKKAIETKSQQALFDIYLALRTKVDLTPSNIESWRALAMFNTNTGRFSEAKAAMKIAMNLEPDNIELKIELAQILLSTENQQEMYAARQLIKEVLKEQPENKEALFILGLNSFQFGLYNRALVTWEQLLKITDPDSAMGKILKKRIARTRELSEGRAEHGKPAKE